MYLKAARREDFKCPHPKKEMVILWGDRGFSQCYHGSQYISESNQHVHLTLIQRSMLLIS